jgi:hypothetical protein
MIKRLFGYMSLIAIGVWIVSATTAHAIPFTGSDSTSMYLTGRSGNTNDTPGGGFPNAGVSHTFFVTLTGFVPGTNNIGSGVLDITFDDDMPVWDSDGSEDVIVTLGGVGGEEYGAFGRCDCDPGWRWR